MVVRGVAGDGQGGREFAERLGAPSFVLAPLVSRGVAIGLIVADNLYSGRPIEEDDVEVLGMFASQAALAISNAEAYRRQGEQMQQLAQAYRQLSEAQRQLVERERLAAIGKMAAHVAHEIRNPLVTIGGYARLMLKDAALSRTARNATGVIAEEVTRLERILRGVMDFTRPPQAVLAPGAVGDVVRHVLKLIEEQARSQNVRVQVEMAAGVPLVRLDPGQMSQVFLNVAQNALDAMPGGGRLTVRVWAEESGVLVDIGNDGLPIAKEHLASIFEPFFTTKKGGTGLGLAVSRKIVHDHLGEITVRSDAAEGTHFTVKLPLAPAGAGEDATSPPLGPTSDR
jgi:signal transduction histidine kinase